MKYLINLSIIFDTSKKQLSLYGDDKICITLTNPAARLLIELIRNNGAELTRDDLLTRVWVDYGFADSNASLNNCISELRKAFNGLGMTKKVILTIPKVGFRMDAQLQSLAGVTYTTNMGDSDNIKDDANVDRLTPPNDADKAITPAESTVDTTPTVEIESSASQITEEKPEPEHNLVRLEDDDADRKVNRTYLPKRGPSLKAKKFILLVIAALGTAAISALLFHRHQNSTADFLYQEDQCIIATLGNTKHSSDLIQRVKMQFAEYNIDCKTARRDIFYVENKYRNKINNMTLLTVCDVIDSEHYSHCQNFKHVE